MGTPDQVIELIDRFHRNAEAYLSPHYNEAQVRKEFVEPLFQSMGWDIYNVSGYAEAYKDVIFEDSIKIGGVTKAPDYCFRVGGARKFFVEAKKPSLNIKDDASAAFQLRRYAWSAKLPLSILTNFKEWAVYDCRIRPEQTDKASAARTLYVSYDEYPVKWEMIASIFSRESVLKGSFDKYAEAGKGKKGAAEVDVAFLNEIETWREMLARNIAMRNPSLSQRDLNFGVQMTIDRIIFLRICEDRGIESYGRLMGLINGTEIYQRLCGFFHEADEKYNSGLFHFKEEKDRNEPPDSISLRLAIDDDKLKKIIRSLYYPDSPYEFSVLPADILGQVYEQFLGKVIRLTPGHRAVVEDKPEVKKAGGVFYTPTFIVDYIVSNTIARLLEGKAPQQAAKIRILDPACGSGSFLLGAYQYLLNWHRDQYAANPEKNRKKIYKSSSNEWRLSTDEKKRILLNNIFGVDIDSQAVEVTKLSLLLKVLENENQETINSQIILFHKRALPDLSRNIKCGNSLIGPDFYRNGNHNAQQLSLLDDNELYRVNVFDWNAEFHEIFKSKNPGFDVVVGNPPYGYIENQTDSSYFSQKFHRQDSYPDLYLLFLEKYESLLKTSGVLGVIVSNTWLQSVTLRRIREYLATHYRWRRLMLPGQVFRAVVDTHVLIFEKTSGEIPDNEIAVDVRQENEIRVSHTLPASLIPRNGDPINIIAPVESQVLFNRIKAKYPPLESFFEVYNGVKPFEKGKGTPPQTERTMKEKPFVKQGPRPGPEWLPLLRGSLIQRYANLWDHNYWILYGPWLAAPRDPDIFKAPFKIVVRQTGDSLVAAIIEKKIIARNNLHLILSLKSVCDLCYVLGLLNSKLMDFVYTFINPEKGEALAEVKKRHIELLPIRPINFSNPKDKKMHDKMVSFVDQMLSLHEDMKKLKMPHDKTAIKRRIDILDDQINRLVYELYSLSDKEIAIIEESTK